MSSSKSLMIYSYKLVSTARNTIWQYRLIQYLLLSDQKVFKNMATFNFEQICVHEDELHDTDTKYIPKSVSILSNLIEQLVFLCNSNPGALVESFVGWLATHSKARMKLQFLTIDTNMKTELNQIFSLWTNVAFTGNQYWNLKLNVSKKKKKSKMSQHSFYKHKRYTVLICRINFKDIYCNLLPVFGFNSAKNNNNLMKRYLPPILFY